MRIGFEGLVGDVNDRVFTDTLVMKLSARPQGAIHYTLDGSEPTVASPAYSGPRRAWRMSSRKTTYGTVRVDTICEPASGCI